MAVTDDEHAVGALGANGLHPAFGEGIDPVARFLLPGALSVLGAGAQGVEIGRSPA